MIAEGAPRTGAESSDRSGPKTLRILTVTNMYPTPAQPVLGTFVAEQVASLRARGLLVDVLFIDGPGSIWNYARGPIALRRAMRGTAYDLIHAHYVFSGLIGRTQRRLPIVLTHHGIETQQGWTAPLCRLASRLTDATIAASPAVAAGLGLPGVTILPCGVDTDLFRPMARSEARARLGLDAAEPLILFLGQPRPEKRLPLIEAAVARLQATVPAPRLLKVHDQPRAVIPYYLNAADVLVLASVAEGSPLAVREAMACNTPVVCTDVGDVRTLCGDLPGHYLLPRPSRGSDLQAAPAGEADALAAQLAAALAFGGRTGGRERILPWSLAAVAKRVEDLYRTVLQRRAPERHS
jgi:glycosyltransferase involved in cell wall biosynthesis